MKQRVAQLIFSFALAMSAVDAKIILTSPIPHVQYIDADPLSLRKRPLRRRYSKVWS